MNKKTAVTFGCIFLGVAIISVSTVMFFRYLNIPMVVETIAEEVRENYISQKEESSAPVSVPPIKAEPKAVIEEPSVSKPEDSVPPPEVIETVGQDGVIQTPNWEAQKELAPGTDLEDPNKQPEYVNSQAASSKPQTPASSSSKAESSVSSSKPSAPTSSSSKAESSVASSKQSGNTPKNGATKTENGQTYTYDKAFGWIKDGNGGTTEYIDAPTTGNKVGH